MEFLKLFGDAFSGTLEKGIRESSGDYRRVAVFDADGTLWDKDLGEAFMRWLIAMRKLKDVDYYTDIFADYEARVEADRTAAYGYAVQLMQGNDVTDIKRWSSAFAQAWATYRPRMRALVEGLKELGFETWIVSASNHWTIGEAAPYAGIPVDCCHGIQTEVELGVITTNLVTPVTCNQGKVDAINEYIGLQPIFAFGDSLGDYEMLKYARYGMGVEEFGAGKSSFRTAAADHGWPVEVF
jgi:HAD superfamily phosphoserine phosphatase-like hydrolase